MLDWSERQGIPLVLVDMPVSGDLEHRFRAEFAQYEACLADLERTRSVRVLRGNREAIGLTDAHFGDLIHLNAEGTARFCTWLRKELTTKTQSTPRQEN